MTELVITKLRQMSTGEYTLEVVLDDSAVHLHYFRATIDPVPDGMTEAEWLDAERDRLRPLAQAMLDHVEATEGPALDGEGDPL